MTYDLLRAVLVKKGYNRYTCSQCGLAAWSMDKTAKTCGNKVCRPHPSKSFQGSVLTPDALRRAFEEFFVRDHSSVGVSSAHVLNRASTITTYAETNYMFAGVCAFNRMTRKQVPAPILEKYGSKLFIQNQFCFRFQDLNEVGVTMRHGSGFTMMGLHCFEKPTARFPPNWQAYWFECIYDFFLSLGFPAEDLYFNEDYWKGDGNGGNCIEFFYQGVELGNVVFIDEILDPLESRELRILDVGLGFERILAARGAAPVYLSDSLRDHLRSLIVGTHDGAMCSKIGIGYSMRKLVERIHRQVGGNFKSVEPLVKQVSLDLKRYFDANFEASRGRLQRIYDSQIERIIQ